MYWISETVAPGGYELLAEPIPVVVAVDAAGVSTVTQVSVDANGKPVLDEADFAEASVLTTIVNVEKNAGFVLPLTGGMGTAILAIAGVALLAVVLIVARRRRSADAVAE